MRVLSAALILGLAVPAMADDAKTTVKEGDKVPDVTLPATGKQKEISLRGLKGKNVVLFFYPKAMTHGCTIESCGFRDVTDELAKLDTVVIGISTDTLAEQQQFTDKEHLNFPLLADPEKKVTKAFGALSDRGFASRYTFVIDKTGTVRKVYTNVNSNIQGHPAEVVKYVKENLAK
jgi:thioredoxin-dependent peroxiredoxin